MSSCGCIYVSDNGDSGVILTSRQQTANKEHKCCECSRVIARGEPYIVESGFWEGRAYRYKTCVDCISLREEFFCNGWIYGEVVAYVTYHVADVRGEISSECLDRLTPAARGFVVDLIDKEFEKYSERGEML